MMLEFPLRIYTALKPESYAPQVNACLFPYEFTLLSNPGAINEINFQFFPLRIYTALKLTAVLGADVDSLFPLRIYTTLKPGFSYPSTSTGLFPLRIYTTLKHGLIRHDKRWCLFPPRIYTALKQLPSIGISVACLFPLRIYTTLKPVFGWFALCIVCFPYEFTLLSNKSLIVFSIEEFVSPTNLHCSQTSPLSG